MISSNKQFWLILIFFGVSFTPAFSQIDRQFWFAIPKETSGHGYLDAINNVSFKFAAMDLDAHVKISMPANPSFTPRTFTIAAGKSRVEVMATSWAEFEKIYANPAPINAVGTNDTSFTGKTSYPNGRGFLIESDNDITVYYDYDNYWNRQLFSLKGQNSLGYEFYTPFQNIWTAYTYARSDIDIVATEDGTVIQVDPSVRFQGRPDMSSFTITLNKGETYSLVAFDNNPTSRPAGTHLKVLSGGPITVTVNDDSVGVQGQGCRDIVGDQIVPVTIIGTKYLVMCGYEATQLTNSNVQEPKRGEQIFVIATQPGTVVTYVDTSGAVIRTSPSLSAGGVDYISPDVTKSKQNAIFVNANNPVYVFHITGITCEVGGALLPPITDCTGSPEVTFYRSSTVNKLTLNLMIPYDQTKPFDAADQSYKFFRIYYDNGTSVALDPTWFEPIRSAGWAALKYEKRDMSTALIPMDQAVKIVNEKDYFHLGITNGANGQTDKYGYFSSYNKVSPSAVVAGVNEPAIVACFGDTVILKAKGGLKNGYTWHYGTPTGPPTYLSDYTSATPRAFCPPGTHNFHVTIHLAKCFGDVTLPVTVFVQPEVKASFETDKTIGCAPMNIKVVNKSTGGNIYEWTLQKDNNPEISFVPSSDLNFNLPNAGFFQNNTSPYAPNHYTIRLKTSIDYICKDSLKKEIVIYPQIKASFLPLDTAGCSPVLTNFRNLSGGNVTSDSYTWAFGDGNSSIAENPVHNYDNFFKIIDTTYKVQLIATSPYYCRDTARANLTVHPYIKAGFTVDTVRGCSPLTIRIVNNSLNRKAIGQYIWDFGDGTSRNIDKDTLMHTYPVNIGAIPKSYKLLLTVKHALGNGCPDTISKTITVYPQANLSFITTPGTNDFCDSTIVTFTTTANAAVSSFIWDFGDGNSSTLQNPTHLFTNTNTSDKVYHVKLTGMSKEYCNGYGNKDITVHAFLDPQISISGASFCAPFNANIKNKSRGGITSYEWKYGDGTSDKHSITDTVHYYRNATSSVFAPNVKLVVANSGGCKDSISQKINIYPEIKAEFTPGNVINCNPFPVSFTNKSNYLNQVSKFYKWDFGDNTTSSLQDPSHIFTNYTNVTAIYPVKLTVTSDFNCSDDTVINISVYPYVEAKFSVDTAKGCSPFRVNVHNSSRGGITAYIWTYGDGVIDSHATSEYSHTYINNTANNPTYQPLQQYLKVQASNSSGLCKSLDSILITTYPEVEAKFITDVTEGCNPLTVRYSNLSGPGSVPVQYDWVFGDGGTAVAKNTSHTFQNLTSSEKTFQTQLRAYSTYKCSDTVTATIKVYPFIKADFAFDKAEGCSPLTINITNSSSQGSKRFIWNFDDGRQDTVLARSFIHTYRNLGSSTKTFYPRLIADYNGKCQDTVKQSLQVYPEVTALFTQDTLKGCHPLPIRFTNQSKNADYFKWVFGDKATSIVTSPQHVYNNFSNVDSVYNLSLTATSLYNCKSTINKQVRVYAKPKALLDVDKSVSCAPFDLTIRNLSQAGDYYSWVFGDGDSIISTNMLPVTHVYDNYTPSTVVYELKLKVQSVNNCIGEMAQSINIFPRVLADFVPDSSGCSPFLVPLTNKTVRAVTYKWDFGDKITSALKDPTHKFFNNSVNDTIFKVGMIGFSELGCSDTAFRQVLVHPQPMTEFSALPSHLYFPDAQVNIDNQTNVGFWNYKWDFGDHQTTTAIEPTLHEYLHWGEFNITLKVWSNYCSDSVTHRIRVFAAKPIADFDASENGCVPITIEFTNHSTWATSYKWEFDDGSVSTEVNPSHIYGKAGKYQVKLTAYGDGGEDVTYRQVEVYPKPVVEFTVSPRLVMLPDALVQTYNTSKLGNSYLWYFGDGDTAKSFEPAHTYKELGTFDITLNIWTEHKCFDSIVMKEAVKVKGNGKLEFPNAFAPNKEGPKGGKYDRTYVGSDIFHPFHDGVAEYKLEIYDRWGELLFESADPYIGWDGYYKGKLCKSDVYIWKANGKFYNGLSFNKAGDVTLLQ